MDKLLQNCNKYDIMHLVAIARDYFSKNWISDEICHTAVHIRRHIEVVITGLTRNQLYLTVPWVRIPPSPPTKTEHLSTDKCSVFVYPSRRLGISSRCSRVYHQGRQAALVSHHAPACICLRLDDMQCFALMIYRNKLRMIYKASPWFVFRKVI